MLKTLLLSAMMILNMYHIAWSQCNNGYYTEDNGTIVICGKGVFSFDTLRYTQPKGTAIRIDTDDSVTIRNTVIISRANFIVSPYAFKANLTVENCAAYPYTKEIEAQPKGYFVHLDRFKSAVIRNNYLEHTRGILLHGQFENQTYGKIEVSHNRALNIDGRVKAGENVKEVISCFAQIAGIKKAEDVLVAWNEVVNEPYNSWVRDVINLYNSSGTPENPIVVANNYIQGAYSYYVLEAPPNYCRGGERTQLGYFGGGIMLGDGSIKVDGKIDTTRASAYLVARYNQVIGTSNYGIAISSGHHNTLHDNTVISCGRVEGQPVLSNNIGGYIANLYKDNNSYPQTYFKYNTAYNNTVGYVRMVERVPNGRCGDTIPVRSDTWFPHGYECTRNTSYIPNARQTLITAEMEEEEYLKWKQKLADEQVHLGPAKGGEGEE